MILVDEDDQEVGFLDKNSCHNGAGKLHRAFSLFVFNDAGEVLLQQRSAEKRLWPMYWSNSCCSHPRRGEETHAAATRRLHEELSQAAELDFIYKFEYHARFGDLGSEHELCWVYTGQTADAPVVNLEEVEEIRWIDPDALDAQMLASPETFTPWFKLEWHTLRQKYPDRLPIKPCHQS